MSLVVAKKLTSNSETTNINPSSKAMELEGYERKQMTDMYEMIRSDADQRSIEEMLLSHEHLLDREIHIMVFHDCQCLGMFEKPCKMQPVSDYSDWIRRGRCRCVGNHDQRVSLRLLHIAAALGYTWLTNFLLDHGCDVCALTQHFHHSALHLSVYHFEPDIIDTLVERACEKLKTTDNSGLLQIIITKKADNYLLMLKRLIDSGLCDVNESDELSDRSLATAIELNDPAAVEVLLSMGADPNLPNTCGNPMLNKALNVGSWTCVKALLDAGVDVNASCKELRHTALICAVSSELFNDSISSVPVDIVKLLLECGADTNAMSYDGYAAIHFASEVPNIEYIKLLLNHGADINLSDTFAGTGFCALHRATSSGNLDFLMFLLNNGALPDLQSENNLTALSLAASNNHLNCLQTLLKYPVNVNNIDKGGDTPLHAMAFIGNKEGVVALLDRGANPDIANDFEATALWNAVFMGHTDIVHILARQNVVLEVYSRGNDQFLYDSYNFPYLYNQPHSTLWVAIERKFPNIANFLVEIGYDIWQEEWLLYSDNRYETISHYALDHVIENLQEAVQNVPSLLSQCRRYFRKKYPCRLLSSVISHCPLPVSLKEYIMLRDVPCPKPD